MKNKLAILFLLFSISCYSQQIKIGSVVKDGQTKEPLAYCSVSILGTRKGTITNADGGFTVTVKSEKDLLEFSYLGYESKTIPASELQKNECVFLQKNTFELQEVEIHADIDYLYDILVNSRKKLQQNNSERLSKAYYAIETKATPLEIYSYETNNDSLKNPVLNIHIISPEEQEEKTVELLECFYNASMAGDRINDLKFRNGKVFSQRAENFYFSLNSSKAMGLFCFFEKNEIFPSCPFQYGKSGMKRIFNLELLSFDGNNYNIKFYPRDNSNKYFSGDVWIEKKSMQVLKVNLVIDNAEVYPLVPSAVVDTVKNFSLKISNSFNPQNGFSPDYTAFDYSFNYVSKGGSFISESNYKNSISKINSKGLIYYYDYESPFILPFFDYDYDYNDYVLLSLFPYNNDFWEANNIVQLTENQKEKFEIGNNIKITKNDVSEDNNSFKGYFTNKESGWFSDCFVFWLADKRIQLAKPSQMEDFLKSAQQTPFPDELCKLEIQILLDVTEKGDSVISKSWTVFDTMNSVYKYVQTSETGAFLNIYFDICEIERRKMQTQLDENKYTLSEIEAIYNSTKSEIDKITKQFLDDSDRGRDNIGLKKWNKYVLENLGINNLELIKDTEETN